MDQVCVAVMGAGSIRCTPAVLASLANYFGERGLAVRLYDSDEERLELFDMVGRAFFAAMKSGHGLQATSDPHEALEDADRVLLMMDDNCLRKYNKATGHAFDGNLDRAYEEIVELIPPTADVLSLEPRDDRFRVEAWPGELRDEEQVSVALENLRIARGEENPFPILKKHAQSPLKEWLDGVRLTEI